MAHAPQYVFGLDFGGTRIKLGLLNDAGEVLAFQTLPTPTDKPAGDVVCGLAQRFKQIASEHRIEPVGVGIGSAGLVDHVHGVIRVAANIPCLNHAPIVELMTQATGWPALLENDANVAAYGEFHKLQQELPEARNVALLVVGTGVGGGVVLNGEVWRGAGLAGEIGHIIVHPDGEPCPCGQRGCLERYASARAIEARAAVELADLDPQPADCEAIADLAFAGCDKARAILDDAMRYLAIACLNVNRLLDLDAFVIGGGVSHAGEPFRQSIEHAFDQLNWSIQPRTAAVRLASLGNHAGITGAAMLALRREG